MNRILQGERILKAYVKLQKFSNDIVDSKILKKVAPECFLREAGCVSGESSGVLYVMWETWEVPGFW